MLGWIFRRSYKPLSTTQHNFGIGGIDTFHGCNLLKTMVIFISYDCIILAREERTGRIWRCVGPLYLLKRRKIQIIRWSQFYFHYPLIVKRWPLANQHASAFDGNVIWDKYLNTNIVWKLKDISSIYCQFVSYFIVEWLTFPLIFSWIVSQQVMVSETAPHFLVDISTKI